MKRKLALLLAMLTVCSFASCGKSDSSSEDKDDKSSVSDEVLEDDDKDSKDDDDESSDEDESSEEDSDSDEDESSEEDSDSDEDESSEEDSDSDEDESSEEDSDSDDSNNVDLGDFERGTVKDGVYTSNFSDITFTAPEGMKFSSEEEILAQMNINASAMGDTMELYAEIAKQTTIYDMMVSDPVTGDNILVMYENLNAYGSGVADSYDVDTYVETVTTQMEAMSSQGLNYKFEEPEKVNLGGKEYVKLDAEAEYEAMNVATHQTYYIAKEDDYIVAIIATLGTTSEHDDTSYFEQFFS